MEHGGLMVVSAPFLVVWDFRQFPGVVENCRSARFIKPFQNKGKFLCWILCVGYFLGTGDFSSGIDGQRAKS